MCCELADAIRDLAETAAHAIDAGDLDQDQRNEAASEASKLADLLADAWTATP